MSYSQYKKINFDRGIIINTIWLARKVESIWTKWTIYDQVGNTE